VTPDKPTTDLLVSTEISSKYRERAAAELERLRIHNVVFDPTTGRTLADAITDLCAQVEREMLERAAGIAERLAHEMMWECSMDGTRDQAESTRHGNRIAAAIRATHTEGKQAMGKSYLFRVLGWTRFCTVVQYEALAILVEKQGEGFERDEEWFELFVQWAGSYNVLSSLGLTN
jgi:hypothetical protein